LVSETDVIISSGTGNIDTAILLATLGTSLHQCFTTG